MSKGCLHTFSFPSGFSVGVGVGVGDGAAYATQTNAVSMAGTSIAVFWKNSSH